MLFPKVNKIRVHISTK